MIVASAVALGFTACLTPIVRWGALEIKWEHRPDPSKWKREANPHAIRIAMGGGWAIWGGILCGVFLALLTLPDSFSRQHLLVPLLLATGALGLGFYDDLRSPSPKMRLLFQTLLGSATVALVGWARGLPTIVAIPVTVFGIVGLTNSVNMMDNMDGVASGLMTLTMLGYAALGAISNNPLIITLGLIVAGAALGFWLYNKPPARIFMGDTGSLLLGYLLAIVGVTATWGDYIHWFSRFAAPFLIASVFIMDTTFVVLWRWRHGLPVMRGDRNHTSHRLAVWLGGEWQANIALYVLQSLMVGLAFIVTLSPLPISVLLTLGALGILLATSYRLWKVPMQS